MSGSGFSILPRGNLLAAIPEMIADFERGFLSQSKIAFNAGIERRTLRTALRKGEKAASGPLRDLHLAELASRAKRPWGCISGPGKSFPKPSARTRAERAGEARMWAELREMFSATKGNPNAAEDETDASPAPNRTLSRTWDPERDLADLLCSDQKYEPNAPTSKSEEHDDEAASEEHRSAEAQPPVKRGRGRPRNLNLQLIESIATTIRYGSSRADTAAGLGLHPRTLPKWLARGKRESEGVYAELYHRVTEARRRRSRPSRLIEVIHSTKAAGGSGSLELNLSALEALRKRTAVRFIQGERVDGKPHLIELRWPKPGRKLTQAQNDILKQGLQVSAFDTDRGLRSIIFVAAPPAVRARPHRKKATAMERNSRHSEEFTSLCR
jgi:hypothetical protein